MIEVKVVKCSPWCYVIGGIDSKPLWPGLSVSVAAQPVSKISERFVTVVLQSHNLQVKTPRSNPTTKSVTNYGVLASMEAEQELKRRRERGRQAQAAFRKRQAKAAQSIQEEHQKLREAIESIVRVASIDDRPELLSAIRQAAGAAGVEAEHLEVSVISNVALSASTAVLACPSYGSVTATHNNTMNSAMVNIGASNWKSRAVPAFTWSKAHQHYRPPVVMGNFWFDPLRATNITTTPEDVVPYVGQGRYTLGGLLFWGVLDHVTNACTHAHNPTSCEELQSNLRRSMSHSKLLSMAKAHRQSLHDGLVDGKHAITTDQNALPAMRRTIDGNYASERNETSAWLLPKEVEGHVRRRLGRQIFGRLELAAKAPDSSEAHRALKETIHKMVDAFMCFGNGPSWNDSFVDLVFNEWAAQETHRC
ncbi:hypothetical protein PGQ11_010766 [Apiospora arundinis]|uniref:BZIP domain-containing protein n=1 Tax=Apiospora arundinis TaxID=335852 RepID=A0ABR2IB68_9PEZI